jgi:hypothetical protein
MMNTIKKLKVKWQMSPVLVKEDMEELVIFINFN